MLTRLTIIALLLFSPVLLLADGPDHPSVLLVSSYHPGFPTFFQQIEGIQQAFEGVDIRLDVEFMDSKRFLTEENLENFRNQLEYKLQFLKYDLIICADDNALRFALEHRVAYFADLPIVFLGINDKEFALEQNKDPLVTGVVEDTSMEETLALITQLQSECESLYIIVDSTPTGQTDLRSALRLRDRLDGIPMQILDLSQISYQELSRKVAQIPVTDAILFLSGYHDNQGQSLDFEQSIDLVLEAARTPVFHPYEHGLGRGVLGGKVVSHFMQGLTAGNMAKDILLGGVQPGAIAVMETSPNQHILDWNVVEDFGIHEKDLPEGVVWLNRPMDPLEDYYPWIFIGALVFLTQTSFLILLILSRRRRLATERALRVSEERTTNLVENSPVSIWEEDASQLKRFLKEKKMDPLFTLETFMGTVEGAGEVLKRIRIVDVNQATLELYGSRDKVSFFSQFSHSIPQESFPVLLSAVMALDSGKLPYKTEVLHKKIGSDEKFWVHFTLDLLPGSEDSWDRVILIIQDIDHKKREEERQQAALQEKEILLKEIHHRVKNNLAIVDSLIGFQITKISDPQERSGFGDVRGRIQSMSLVHEMMYKSENFRNINVDEYIRRILTQVLDLYPSEAKISGEFDIDPDLHLEMEQLIPMGLMLTEGATNAIKHAFKDHEAPRISLAIQSEEDMVNVILRDNGPGLKDGVLSSGQESLGTQLIFLLASQLGGRAAFSNNHGCQISITFPKKIDPHPR